jgi:hypothetical protein
MEIRVRGGLCRKLAENPGGFVADCEMLRWWIERDGERRVSSLEAIQRVGCRIAKDQPYELDDGVTVTYDRGTFTVKVKKVKVR